MSVAIKSTKRSKLGAEDSFVAWALCQPSQKLMALTWPALDRDLVRQQAIESGQQQTRQRDRCAGAKRVQLGSATAMPLGPGVRFFGYLIRHKSVRAHSSNIRYFGGFCGWISKAS
jgi:hypothetical protein